MSRDFRDDPAHDSAIDPESRHFGYRGGRVEGGERNEVTGRGERTAPPQRTEAADRTWSPANRLDLPRTPDRRPVALERDLFRLRGSESELLATIGTFRAIAIHDLKEVAANAGTDRPRSLDADLRSLRDQALLNAHALVMNGRSEHVVVLTRNGHDLLERSRPSPVPDRSSRLSPRPSPSAPRHQRYYAGVARARDLAHDAQLYRMFETERERLEAERGTVTRVVLDYELKGDYHRYVHDQHLTGVDETYARRAFADEHHLPFAGERIHLPDVRIEYETEDGRTEYRDLELATEHYSRSQLGGKVSAGFRVYRAAGAGAGSRRGGAPADPHRLEWIS
jgi:hypothetical protein